MGQRYEVLANVGASSTCVAAAVIVFNPLDCLRVRWQVEPRGGAPSLLAFAQRTIRTEGLLKGLWQPGLMANASAAAVSRGLGFGLYPTIRDGFVTLAGSGEKSPTFMFLAGLPAGALGYGISCPLWQMKTRLQAEAGLLKADGKTMMTGRRAGLPRLYANTAQGLAYIVRNEGLANLYRGTTPLMVRGALMNAGNTLGYDSWKSYVPMHEGSLQHVCASVFAAFCSCTFSCPADLLMTRFQTAQTTAVSSGDGGGKIGGKIARRGISSIAGEIMRNEGPLGFYRGWTALFIRVAPLYCCFLPVYERFRLVLGLGYMD